MKPDRPLQRTFRIGWASAALFGLSLATVGVVQGVLKLHIMFALLAGLPFAALAIRVRARETSRQQRVLDTDAAALLARIDRGETPRFSLYLRTFAVTGVLQTGQKAFETVSPLLAGPELDFETVLAQAVESDAPLVALGKPGEHEGGARRILTSEGTWQPDIVRLADRAVTIFVIPSGRPGTAWEIDTIIRSGLWAKSVFLMPPGAPGSLAVTWDADRDRLAAAGVSIPKYSAAGMVFTIDQRGQVRGRADFPADARKLKPSALAAAIRNARADAAATPDVDATAVPSGAGLVTSNRCPKCGGTKVRPRTPKERKAIKALVAPNLDDLWTNLDRPDEREEFSRRATCADCGTTYMRPPPSGGLICLILSVVSGVVLYGISQSGAVEGVIERPKLQEVLIVGIGLLVLVPLSLAFPVWCAAKIVAWVGRKRSDSAAEHIYPRRSQPGG